VNMKKLIVILIVLLVLGIILGVFLLRTEDESTIKIERPTVSANGEDSENFKPPVQPGLGAHQPEEPVIPLPPVVPENPQTYYIGEDGLPRYIPGSITLMPDHYWDFMDPPMQLRRVFYTVPNSIIAWVGEERAIEWLQSQVDETRGIYPYEMLLMQFIQHFNISKEDFVYVIEMERAFFIEAGRDLAHEENELPNADIIFTFDMDIIRYYYGRE